MTPRWETIFPTILGIFTIVSSVGSILPLRYAILELLEACSSLKFRLINNEEVTWSTLREVRLRQDILHACYRAHLSLVIDILQLVNIIWLIDNPVTSFKVYKSILVE